MALAGDYSEFAQSLLALGLNMTSEHCELPQVPSALSLSEAWIPNPKRSLR